MIEKKEKKKRRFPFLIVLLSIILAGEIAGLIYVMLPVFSSNTAESGPALPLALMRREEPDTPVIRLDSKGYQCGGESGSYTYDSVTGIYSLDNGSFLRVLRDRYELVKNGEVTVLADNEMLKTPRWHLYGSTTVKVPGGYTMDVDFTLALFEDGTCRLSNSLSETVFDGTWVKNADGSLKVDIERMKMTESVPGRLTLSGNIGLSVTVTLEGEVE